MINKSIVLLEATSFKSAPTENALSLPVKITDLTEWSLSKLVKASPSSSIKVRDKAFNTSGRFKVTSAIPASKWGSTLMYLYCLYLAVLIDLAFTNPVILCFVFYISDSELPFYRAIRISTGLLVLLLQNHTDAHKSCVTFVCVHPCLFQFLVLRSLC